MSFETIHFWSQSRREKSDTESVTGGVNSVSNATRSDKVVVSSPHASMSSGHAKVCRGFCFSN